MIVGCFCPSTSQELNWFSTKEVNVDKSKMFDDVPFRKNLNMAGVLVTYLTGARCRYGQLTIIREK